LKERKLLAEIRSKDRTIRRLRRENEYLRHREKSLSGKAESGIGTPRASAVAGRILRSGGYLGYLWLTVKSTTVYKVYDKVFFAVRKYMLASSIFKIVIAVLSFLKTSAAFIIIFGILAVLAPAILIFGTLMFVISMFSYTKLDRATANISSNVYAFAPHGRTPLMDDTAAEVAAHGKVVNITTSFSKCAFSGAKRRADGTLDVHVSYFFRMKKILEKNGIKIYFIS